MCKYHATGVFCSHACTKCDRRMAWRQLDARISARNATARLVRQAPKGSK